MTERIAGGDSPAHACKVVVCESVTGREVRFGRAPTPTLRRSTQAPGERPSPAALMTLPPDAIRWAWDGRGGRLHSGTSSCRTLHAGTGTAGLARDSGLSHRRFSGRSGRGALIFVDDLLGAGRRFTCSRCI